MTIEAARKNTTPSGVIQLVAKVDVVAQEGEGGGPPTFSMLAYSGSRMSVAGFPDDVVVDLASLKTTERTVVLRDHDHSRVVGHATRVDGMSGRLLIEGVMSGAGQHKSDILEAAKNGFPWQASVGVFGGKVEQIGSGESVRVNGQKQRGPLAIVRGGTLREVSIVALGADDKTSARIAARKEAGEMDFDQWLAACGIDADTLTDEGAARLRAAYDAEQADDDGGGDKPSPNAPSPNGPTITKIIEDDRKKEAAEYERRARIGELCGDDHPRIAAQAIEEGWTPEQAELAMVRATRPRIGPGTGRARSQSDPRVVEAGLCLGVGVDQERVLADYGEKHTNEGRQYERVGLRELCDICASIDGFELPRVFGDGQAHIEAAASSATLSKTLENVMQKLALQMYEEADQPAMQVSRVGSVRDFKQVTRVRLLGTGSWERVAHTGELKHGQLDEQSFVNQAETFGQMIGIDRKDIINDDLGALETAARSMGFAAAEAVNDEFTRLILNNKDAAGNDFFSAANNNLIDGADSAFGVTGLEKIVEAFLTKKSGPGGAERDKRRIRIQPQTIMVPPELQTSADRLLGSPQMMITGSTDLELPRNNPFFQRFDRVTAQSLSDSFFANASSIEWYMFANPARVAAVEAVFLNGQRSPTLRRVASPPHLLGVYWQGFIDFGFQFQDPNGAVKAAGE